MRNFPCSPKENRIHTPHIRRICMLHRYQPEESPLREDGRVANAVCVKARGRISPEHGNRAMSLRSLASLPVVSYVYHHRQTPIVRLRADSCTIGLPARARPTGRGSGGSLRATSLIPHVVATIGCSVSDRTRSCPTRNIVSEVCVESRDSSCV